MTPASTQLRPPERILMAALGLAMILGAFWHLRTPIGVLTPMPTCGSNGCSVWSTTLSSSPAAVVVVAMGGLFLLIGATGRLWVIQTKDGGIVPVVEPAPAAQVEAAHEKAKVRGVLPRKEPAGAAAVEESVRLFQALPGQAASALESYWRREHGTSVIERLRAVLPRPGGGWLVEVNGLDGTDVWLAVH